MPVGPLVALAALRWRRSDARVVLALACVPQTMFFYDQLPLAAVSRTFGQSVAFSVWSYLPIATVPFLPAPKGGTTAEATAILAPVIVTLYFLPCVWMVLRRENREPGGVMAEFVETATAGNRPVQ
jgi:hypothetical protein